MKFIHKGFCYHNSLVRKHNEIRYLACAKYNKSGCHGRATIPTNGDISQLKVTQQHNHPPDQSLGEKIEFYNKLKYLARNSNDDLSFRDMYDAVIQFYLRCLEYKRLGCHARAVIPYDGSIQDIKVNKPHNHPPDFAAEEKIVFMRELKEVMLKNPNVPSRTVYATLSEVYPNAARETPFDLIRHKMNRWRRQQD